MIKASLLLGIFALLGCGVESPETLLSPLDKISAAAGVDHLMELNKYEGIHPELKPFVSSFENEFGIVSDIPVNFGKVGLRGAGAECVSYGIDREIIVSSEVWKRIENTVPQHEVNLWKEQIIFHELGHCVAFREHESGGVHERRSFNAGTGSYDSEFLPSSVMYPKLFTSYAKNRDSYIKEMRSYINRELPRGSPGVTRTEDRVYLKRQQGY